MGKLHQLIAVEPELENSYKAILKETQTVFEKKPQLFFGWLKTYTAFDAEDVTNYTDERQELVTTVRRRLQYQKISAASYFDCLLQKEVTNQSAVADLTVNGILIDTGLPATFLLGLEKRIVALRTLYQTIPTLPQGIAWKIDDIQGQDIYKAEYPERKFKTQRTFNSKVLYEATKEHPAQIEKWDETINVGEYSIDKWCGMISSADKADILARIDMLLIAVKKARQKANECKVVDRKIGDKLMNFINLGQLQ